jgi:hypothetical protein
MPLLPIHDMVKSTVISPVLHDGYRPAISFQLDRKTIKIIRIILRSFSVSP